MHICRNQHRCSVPSPLAGEEGSKGLLDESITFTAPAIGSYYFSMAAVTRVAQHMVDNPLAMYRMVPVAGLPSKAPPPQMTVNLPPNATQAQRMQVRLPEGDPLRETWGVGVRDNHGLGPGVECESLIWGDPKSGVWGWIVAARRLHDR